jgi:hypothetical protein
MLKMMLWNAERKQARARCICVGVFFLFFVLCSTTPWQPTVAQAKQKKQYVISSQISCAHLLSFLSLPTHLSLPFSFRSLFPHARYACIYISYTNIQHTLTHTHSAGVNVRGTHSIHQTGCSGSQSLSAPAPGLHTHTSKCIYTHTCINACVYTSYY